MLLAKLLLVLVLLLVGELLMEAEPVLEVLLFMQLVVKVLFVGAVVQLETLLIEVFELSNEGEVSIDDSFLIITEPAITFDPSTVTAPLAAN